jgi:catechol 2,3-dioxygenase-like lactoylglutathione lyase family enzyme
MSLALTIAPAVRFHLSLNVSDLARSIAFYRVLFGTEPAKCRPDYAKFEMEDPPLVMSLEPTARAAGGPLNHVGFRLPDSETLVAMQARLERAGIRSQREEGVECCYARQTKFWVTDPDKTLWELYTLDEDLDHRGVGQSIEEMIPDPQNRPGRPAEVPPAGVVVEHSLMDAVPDRFPHADGSADEVRLRGSLNVPLDPETAARLMREAARVLRPGGRLFVQTLVGERAVADPRLPGPAGVVRFVPRESSPIHLMESAGFRGVRLVKFDEKPCFEAKGGPMREQQLEGFTPAADSKTVQVVYKGPFRQLVADDGTVFLRGERVGVDAAQAARWRGPEWAGHFLVLG